MVDAEIGRLLIASLHQGIADVAPTRLDFYENWLSPTGLRDGRLGLAPLGAVLSFLNRESPPADAAIPMRAGTYAAVWVEAARPAFRRRLTGRLPLGLRSRTALGLGRALVRDTIGQARVRTRYRRRHGTVDIGSPLFEYLREPSLVPMRHYYRAAYIEFLRSCGVDASVAIDPAAAGCRLTIAVHGADAPGPPPAPGEERT